MKTHLREMKSSDIPKVLEKLEEQNRRDGTSYSMPRVFDANGSRLPSIPLALVAIDDEGNVVQGHVWETTVEQMTFGVAPEATASSMREQDAVFWVLQQKGFRDLHILVPNERVKAMGHELDSILGMKYTAKMLTHFYRLLDPAENAELRKWYEDQEAQNEQSTAGAS